MCAVMRYVLSGTKEASMEIYITIAIMSFLIGVLVGEAIGKAERRNT